MRVAHPARAALSSRCSAAADVGFMMRGGFNHKASVRAKELRAAYRARMDPQQLRAADRINATCDRVLEGDRRKALAGVAAIQKGESLWPPIDADARARCTVDDDLLLAFAKVAASSGGVHPDRFWRVKQLIQVELEPFLKRVLQDKRASLEAEQRRERKAASAEAEERWAERNRLSAMRSADWAAYWATRPPEEKEAYDAAASAGLAEYAARHAKMSAIESYSEGNREYALLLREEEVGRRDAGGAAAWPPVPSTQAHVGLAPSVAMGMFQRGSLATVELGALRAKERNGKREQRARRSYADADAARLSDAIRKKTARLAAREKEQRLTQAVGEASLLLLYNDFFDICR